MSTRNRKQEAGDNSTQIQAEVIQVGIDEKRVREIIKEDNLSTLKEMSIIATDEALKRLTDYTNVFVPKLVKMQLLESFSDPEIQMLFKQSEKTAICTNREKDYEMLSELLIHKVKRKENYNTSAAISKAISEINNISEEALLGLTLLFSVTVYTPTSGNIDDGLSALNDLYGKIVDKSFYKSETKDWIENLDIINAIKLNQYITSKKLEDYYCEILDGYSCLGIKKDSDNYKDAIQLLKKNGIPLDILSDNVFDNGYVRINTPKLNNFDEIVIKIIINNNVINIPLNDNQKKVLSDVVNLYDKNELSKQKFKEKLKTYSNINDLINWWNDKMIKNSFIITPVGRVIGQAYIKNIDPTLPDLD